jgi:hypothetical protein
MSDYAAFLAERAMMSAGDGFTPSDLNPQLFDFQRAIVAWACEKGRAAIFADCGLGKTPMQLEWARLVCAETGGRVLIITPLAVSHQTAREAQKFGVDAAVSRDGSHSGQIDITNYERLHLFDSADYQGVVCDESSILKNYDGATKAAITAFMHRMPYRLLCTATAAPNDYVELGTSAEALGVMGHMDMLNAYFRNQNGNATDTKGHWRGHHAPRVWEGKQWRFKHHAEHPFWRFVCSWAQAMRRPSDLGFSDDGFNLPSLTENQHVVPYSRPLDGKLFAENAVGLHEQREERRATITPRCERIAELVDHDRPALVWCHLNDEGDLLEKLIPDALQVKGAQDDDEKEERLLAFSRGEARVLITKPRIGGFGMNWQHCSHITFFPSHSYEQYYQGVRRCWRFGQKEPVTVDVVTTEGELGVLQNLQRKAAASDRMFTELVAHMNDAAHMRPVNPFTVQEALPSWL